ncbi:hypothetical protein EDB85DRAFT_1894889 [Lactarius pseudohatsudake]|nr:hypothetical protein EDB85DRAFT_1894889 [Lactarius pseudohatsudake]
MPTPNIFWATTSEAWPSVLPPPHPEYACAWSADANPRVRILTNADTKHLWGYHERSTAQQLAVPRSPWRCLHTPSMHSPPMPTPASEYSPTPSGYHERSTRFRTTFLPTSSTDSTPSLNSLAFRTAKQDGKTERNASSKLGWVGHAGRFVVTGALRGETQVLVINFRAGSGFGRV